MESRTGLIEPEKQVPYTGEIKNDRQLGQSDQGASNDIQFDSFDGDSIGRGQVLRLGDLFGKWTALTGALPTLPGPLRCDGGGDGNGIQAGAAIPPR